MRRLVVPSVLLAVVASLLPAPAMAAPPATSAAWRTWTAKSAMISNVGVYRGGEYVYSDYLYDDHGPNTDGIDHTDAPFGASLNPEDPTNPRLGSSGGQIRYAGDFFYGAAGNHYDNVADLLEMRVATDAASVHYRFLLGALKVPDSTVVGVCLDTDRRDDTGLATWPHAAGLVQQIGCDQFLTLYGTGGTVTDRTGVPVDLAALGGAVRADTDANTIEARVPRTVADPATSTWRITAASGLWDATARSWHQVAPGPQVIGAPTPTGGGIGDPQIWDLLSNNDEPNTYWREEKQANDLAAQRIAEHHVDVDFARIASGVVEPDPKLTGVIDRIYESAFVTGPGEGIRISNPVTRNFVYYSRYQPYAVVIPSTYWQQLAADPDTRLPFDHCQHPLNGNHHVEIYYGEAQARAGYNPLITGTVPSTGYLGFSVYENLYDRLNTVYACGNGRGEAVGYTGGDGMVDTIEVWNDVERHYRVDPDKRVLHGISLGAIGTWYVSRLYPDRFSAAIPSIFTPGFGGDNPTLANLYNLPVFYVIGSGDEFGQAAFGDDTADELEALGNEYIYDHQLTREHELSLGDEALPFTVPLMYSRKRVVDPARVRYLFNPASFSPKLPGRGGAYWVDGMRPRVRGTAEIDVVSLGRASELARDQIVFTGVYANNRTGNQARFRGLLRMTPEEFARAWRPSEFEAGWEELSLETEHTRLAVPAVANGFELSSKNLAEVTLSATRMKLDTGAPLTGAVRGDAGDLVLTLTGRFAKQAKATLDGQPVASTVTSSGITVHLPLTGAEQVLRIARG